QAPKAVCAATQGCLARPSPDAGVRHGGPGFALWESFTALQQFDGNIVGRADECHVPIARRPVDRDAGFHEPVAGFVNIFDSEGEMAEIAPSGIYFLVPIIR